MSQPCEQLIRKLYAEFKKGNLEGALALTTPDFQLHIRGDNAIAGDFTRAEMPQYAMRLGGIVGPSLQTNVEAVLASKERAVAFIRDTLTRLDDGRSFELRLLHVFRIEHGKIASLDEMPFDQRAFDEAWAAPRAAALEAEPASSMH